jgi:ABC-type branched-subunit amino acid transport system ATPase component
VRRRDRDARRRGGAGHAPSPTPASTAWPRPWSAAACTSAATAMRRAAPGAVLLQAQDLVWRDALGVPRLDGVSLTLRAGEIVGIAGVSGNGQSELLDVLSGMHAPQSGTLQVGDTASTPGTGSTPATARELRIAHVPEDRHLRGLVLPFPAWESAVLGYQQRRATASTAGCASARCAATAPDDGRYDVRPRNPQLRSSKFSGGNQQKLVLAREALPEPAGAAGRPAHARRGHRRHRIHPRPPARDARRRRRGAAGQQRARRDPGAGRPRDRDERRPHRRRTADRAADRAKPAPNRRTRPPDGSGTAEMSARARGCHEPARRTAALDGPGPAAGGQPGAGLLVSAIVLVIVGHDPVQVLGLLVKGAFGSRRA